MEILNVTEIHICINNLTQESVKNVEIAVKTKNKDFFLYTMTWLPVDLSQRQWNLGFINIVECNEHHP